MVLNLGPIVERNNNLGPENLSIVPFVPTIGPTNGMVVCGSSLSESVPYPIVQNSHISKGKLPCTIEGDKGLQRRAEKSGAEWRKDWIKRQRGGQKKGGNAIFRAAAAAISLSLSSNSKGGGNCMVMDEARAVLEMSKVLGLEFGGEEEEIVSKIVELEEEDLIRKNKGKEVAI